MPEGRVQSCRSLLSTDNRENLNPGRHAHSSPCAFALCHCARSRQHVAMPSRVLDLQSPCGLTNTAISQARMVLAVASPKPMRLGNLPAWRREPGRLRRQWGRCRTTSTALQGRFAPAHHPSNSKAVQLGCPALVNFQQPADAPLRGPDVLWLCARPPGRCLAWLGRLPARGDRSVADLCMEFSSS